MRRLAIKAIDTPSQHERNAKSSDRRPTIFEIILSNKNILSSEKAFNRISHEGVVSIAAGGETTARAMMIATYFLLSDKVILNKLEKELSTVMPELSSRPSLKILEGLPWLVRYWGSG